MLENTNNTPIDAVKVVYDMSEDTRIREFVRMREKTLHDYASEMGDAEDRGREEGRKIGLEEGRKIGLEEGRKIGLEEGRKIGLEEGRKIGMQQIIIEEYAAKVPNILRELGIEEEIIQQIIANFKSKLENT